MEERRWHVAYPPGFPHEIQLDERQTLATLIEQAFQTHAARAAASCMDETLRYADLDRLSHAFAAYLQAKGLATGDRVALMLPTSLPFIVALSGALRAGMTVVTVNPLYTPRELEHQLADAGAVVVVALEALLPVLQQVLPRTQVRQVLATPLGGLQSLAEELAVAGRDLAPSDRRTDVEASELPFATAIRVGHHSPWTPVTVDPAGAAFLQYTGGTTGVSKGAVLTHRSVCASTAQMLSWTRLWLPEGAATVTPLPLYHIFALGVAMALWVFGAHNRLVPNPRDVASLVAEMKRDRFDMLLGVNTLFNALVHVAELSSVDFSATRLVIGAGASVQHAVAQRWVAAGAPPITEAYGLTETSPSATFNPPGRNGSIGIPVPSTDVRIVDDAGNDVPLGASGELLLRGPQLFAGYWQRPEETRKAFTQDGWFKTGDIVTMDEAGFMTMVDRKKDMILVSGFNVYPNEIEAIVAMMPQVLECACIGVPDERSGEVPHLFAVPRQAGLAAAEIEAHCRRNLAAYKVPRHITVIDALPKSAVGKILRRELRRADARPAADTLT